jgi:Na+/H+ antiporter NhaA
MTNKKLPLAPAREREAEASRLAELSLPTRIEASELTAAIKDGLMAIFFFVVGLEIKRELVVGELSTVRQAILPVGAALAGAVGGRREVGS